MLNFYCSFFRKKIDVTEHAYYQLMVSSSTSGEANASCELITIDEGKDGYMRKFNEFLFKWKLICIMAITIVVYFYLLTETKFEDILYDVCCFISTPQVFELFFLAILYMFLCLTGLALLWILIKLVLRYLDIISTSYSIISFPTYLSVFTVCSFTVFSIKLSSVLDAIVAGFLILL